MHEQETQPVGQRVYASIIVEHEGYVAIVRLNRPKALNALNIEAMTELVDALEEFDNDDGVRCTVIAGSDRVFAAGADIKEMADASPVEIYQRNRFTQWERIRKLRKPLIAAVSGWALGAGNELAMCCDMVVASETARFGQPEINIGVIPGAGGTQRLTRAVGKARAMEMVLTGSPITAREAYACGLVNRVVPVEVYLEEAKALAAQIASRPPLAVQLGKDAVLKAFDTTIEQGLDYERKNFYLLFATEDMREGMQAFVEKREAEFKGR